MIMKLLHKHRAKSKFPYESFNPKPRFFFLANDFYSLITAFD